MTIDVIGVGTAPGDNTGDGLRTAMTKVNNNFGSSANAASKLVGTATGEIPLSEDLNMVGWDNWTTFNYQPDDANGLGVVRLLKNLSGNTNDGVISAGSSLQFCYATGNTGVVTAVVSPTPLGSWEQVTGFSLGSGNFCFFQRVS